MRHFEFSDAETGDTVACIVRSTTTGHVGLAITFKSNGDLEAVMPPDVAAHIAAELIEAAAAAKRE